ncbi:putative transcription factor B3-Domain family [Helianthus anomalus]
MKSRILPRNYHNWVADFKLPPDGMVQIITTHRRVFTVSDRKAGSSYFFHDGSLNMIQSLLLLIDRFFVHHKLKNLIPTNHVTITAFPNRTWLVFMKKHGQNLYFTTGWNQIKEDMKVIDEHYIIFEMISESKFDMMVFRGTEDLVRIPERRLSRVKVEVKEEVYEEGVA